MSAGSRKDHLLVGNPDAGSDFAIILTVHRSGFWLLVPIELPTGLPLRMVLDTGTFFSGISERLRGDLENAGLLQATGQNFLGSPFYTLPDATIEGREIPPLRLLVSPSATRLGLDGLLGLDFLRQFRRVCFDVDEMRLTLTPR